MVNPFFNCREENCLFIVIPFTSKCYHQIQLRYTVDRKKNLKSWCYKTVVYKDKQAKEISATFFNMFM